MEDLRKLPAGGPEDGVPVRGVRTRRGHPGGYRGPRALPAQPAATPVGQLVGSALFRVRLASVWRQGAVVGCHYENRYTGARTRVLVLLTGPVEWVYLELTEVVESVVRPVSHRSYDVGTVSAQRYARRAGHLGVM